MWCGGGGGWRTAMHTTQRLPPSGPTSTSTSAAALSLASAAAAAGRAVVVVRVVAARAATGVVFCVANPHNVAESVRKRAASVVAEMTASTVSRWADPQRKGVSARQQSRPNTGE